MLSDVYTMQKISKTLFSHIGTVSNMDLDGSIESLPYFGYLMTNANLRFGKNYFISGNIFLKVLFHFLFTNFFSVIFYLELVVS